MSASVFTIIIVVIEVLLIGAVFLIEHKKSPKHKISFQETLNLTDLPIVTFYNNGRKLNFILDTGANRSILNERELSTCRYEETNETVQLMGMDGITRDVTSMVRITLTHGDMDFVSDFQVTDMSPTFDAMKQACGVNIHGILGSLFFTKYKYVIDFDKLMAYTK